MRGAHDRVEGAPVDREPGQPRRPRRVRHVLAGGLGLQGDDLDTRGHDVLRGEVGQVQGPYEQLGGVRLQGAFPGGVPGEGGQLLRAARGGEFLGGFHTHTAHHPVRRVVQVGDEGAEDRAEPALRVADPLGHGQRRGDRPVLRHQLADHHQHDGRQGGADHQRDRARRRAGDAERLQRPRDQGGDRRLGEHADDQVGDRDAELRAGELEGQIPYGLQRARSAPLAALRGPLQLAALDRGQRELGRDERATGERQQDRHQEEEHFGHRDTSVPSSDRAGRIARRRVPGGSPMGGRSHLS